MQKADKSNNWHYNKNLQPYANKLRKRMTKSEACLWKFALRARKMKGYQFRRQRPVLNYIADYMCKELLLVIELDGITHHSQEVQLKDQKKTKNLEAVGFTVLRFPDEQVLNNLNFVIAEIADWIENFEKNHPLPRQRRILPVVRINKITFICSFVPV